MARNKTLCDLWDLFDRGDHLTDAEVMTLIRSAEQGADYLTARREKLAASRTVLDLERLRSYLFWRKNGT